MVKKETFDGDINMEQHLTSDQVNPNEPAMFARRNRPGTSAKDWCKWPNEDLEDMDSTLAVQQFIQQLIRDDASNVELILKPPEQQDEGVWKYEHVRQFCMDLNLITVRLQEECSPSVCSQMTATEQWIFLCAAHKNPKECSAIDYTRHTLDGAACLLNSNRYFPSRVNIKESSVQKLGSVCRRIYRIFSHAYFHHRHIFDEFERETSLCKRFTKFVIKYDLMTSDTLIVPIDVESGATESSSSSSPSPSPSKPEGDESSSPEKLETTTTTTTTVPATTTTTSSSIVIDKNPLSSSSSSSSSSSPPPSLSASSSQNSPPPAQATNTDSAADSSSNGDNESDA